MNCPIFMSRRLNHHSRSLYIEKNPNLAAFGFQSHLDPWTAYQTLASYISGPLAIQMDIPQDIDDVILAQAKGFNEKSFRMDSPGKKRKRRSRT